MITDTIDGVILDEDEDGFYLILSGTKAEYRFNIHGIAHQLLAQAEKEIRPWWREAQESMNATRRALGVEYPELVTDPKHPDHHDVLSEKADS